MSYIAWVGLEAADQGVVLAAWVQELEPAWDSVWEPVLAGMQKQLTEPNNK